jgi:uncharacterized membrane protein (GlpM family)
MNDILLQTIFPFILSAAIVILISLLAERYGTKLGGIIGTLPSIVVIAFLFIALNRDVHFASQSAAVVPAEMGINLVFLLLFSLFAYKSTLYALFISLSFWAVSSSLLVLTDMKSITLSVALYIGSLILTFLLLERVKKIESVGSVKVHYTPLKIAVRGIIAGCVIALAVFLSNIGEVLSGIFSVFPAVFLSTMIITVREHGPEFSAAIAKSMIVGSLSVFTYAIGIYLFYPPYGILLGSIYSYAVSLLVTCCLIILRAKIR